MRTAALRDGQDHDTLLLKAAAFAALLFVASLAALPQLAAAQASPPCTAIENDAERLACYDRALRTAPPATPAPAAAPAAAPPATPAPAAAAPAAAPPAAPAPAAAAPAAAPPAAPAPAAAAPAAAPPANGNRDAEDEDRIIPIVVISVGGLQGRQRVFNTQDGATWVQTDAQRVGSLPATPFEAELKPGTMGSYFLVPKEQGRAIRVRNAAR